MLYSLNNDVMTSSPKIAFHWSEWATCFQNLTIPLILRKICCTTVPLSSLLTGIGVTQYFTNDKIMEVPMEVPVPKFTLRQTTIDIVLPVPTYQHPTSSHLPVPQFTQRLHLHQFPPTCATVYTTSPPVSTYLCHSLHSVPTSSPTRSSCLLFVSARTRSFPPWRCTMHNPSPSLLTLTPVI